MDQSQSIETVDLRYYISILQKWKLVIVVVTAISVLTAGLLSFFVLPPVYETKVTLMVSQAQRMSQYQQDDLQSAVNLVSRLPEMTINTYVGQLTSPYFMGRIIKAAKLDKDLYTPGGLAGMIEARAIKDTNLIEVKVSNNSPKVATDIANALSTEFIQFITENLQDQMGKSVTFLEAQAASADKELKEANEQLRVVQVGPMGAEFLDRDLKTQSTSLSEHQSALLNLRIQIESLTAGVDALETELETMSRFVKPEAGQQPGAPILDPIWQTLTQQQMEKRVSLAEKQALADGYEASIAELTVEIDKLQNLLAERRTAEYRLQKQVAQLEQAYNLLKEKIIQTEMTRSLNIGETNISIVAPAMMPGGPVRPRKMMNMAVAGVLGLMVSVALAFVLEYMDYTIKSSDDVLRHLGVPSLGSVPVISSQRRTNGE